MTEEQIRQIPIPDATNTYAPVSHSNIIDAVQENLDKSGLSIVNKTYNGNGNGEQLIGMYRVNQGNEEMGMMIAFRNSYDKSMACGFAAGTEIFVCSNGMITGEISMYRKHTGTVINEIDNKIIQSINSLENYFNILNYDRENMKNIEINKRVTAELLGRMYIEENLINSTQLNIIKRELISPTFEEFNNSSAWDFYNHCTYSLKKSSAMNMMQDHINIHEFFKNNVIEEYAV